jgi:hypothetical protein
MVTTPLELKPHKQHLQNEEIEPQNRFYKPKGARETQQADNLPRLAILLALKSK